MFSISVSSGPAPFATTAGVITSWSTYVHGADVGDTIYFRTYRPLSGNTYTPTTESGATVLGPTANAVQSFPTRQPVAANDRIGVRVGADGGSNVCSYGNTGQASDVSGYLFGAASLGSPTAYQELTSTLADVSARLEADADGDGYGDETQDACPTNASTQGTCPAPPPPDSDGDGVPDGSDACPSVAAATADGCPAVSGPTGNDAACAKAKQKLKKVKAKLKKLREKDASGESIKKAKDRVKAAKAGVKKNCD